MERVELSKRLLAALRPRWVQETFHISASTKNNQWARTGIPPARIEEVLGAVRGLIGQEKSPPPEWARGLTDEVLNEFRLLRADLLGRSAGRVAEIAVERELGSRSPGEASADSPRGLLDRGVTRGEP